MLHLIKMSVGSLTFQSLNDWQKRNAFKHKTGKEVFVHGTTMRPTRFEELVDGGSIYWVVKGFIIGRNPLVAVEFDDAKQGRARCSLVCGLPMMGVSPRRHRAFQGWRYLKPADAPPDMARGKIRKSDIPAELAGELSDLGLL